MARVEVRRRIAMPNKLPWRSSPSIWRTRIIRSWRIYLFLLFVLLQRASLVNLVHVFIVFDHCFVWEEICGFIIPLLMLVESPLSSVNDYTICCYRTRHISRRAIGKSDGDFLFILLNNNNKYFISNVYYCLFGKLLFICLLRCIDEYGIYMLFCASI